MRHIAKIGLIWFFPLIILFLLCASITAAGQENQNRETLAAVAAAAGGQSREDEEQKKLSAAVESYREKILEKAKSVGIEEYVEHLLAIMQVSSGGLTADCMASSLFDSNTLYAHMEGGITDPDYSIECGIKEFSSLLDLCNIKGPQDTRLLVVYQAFHVGRKYAEFNEYTQEGAASFIKTMGLVGKDASFAQQVQNLLIGQFSGTLLYPLPEHTTISSPFGSRPDPFGSGKIITHYGIDFPAPAGTAVLATAGGVVKEANWNAVYGLHVVIQHNSSYQTLYGHCQLLYVTEGQTVSQGTKIAEVGNTGQSTGYHLHLGLLYNGKYIDPKPFLSDGQEIESGETFEY